MKAKHLLTTMVLGMAGTGIIIAAYPFISSMEPNAKAFSALRRIKITGLEVGTYRIQSPSEKTFNSNGWDWKVLLYKKSENKIKAWTVPTRNGAVGMPDFHWWRPLYECKNFGPTLVNGIVDELLPIQCHDKDAVGFWGNKWKWDIEGKSLGTMVDDLKSVNGHIEGEYFTCSDRC